MFKKARLLLIVLISLIVLSITTVVYARNATVQTDNLNVRSGPGTEYDVIGQVHTDESYPIIEEQGDWVKVKMNQSDGWLTKDYISTTESDSNTESNLSKTVTVRYDKTNIRKGPSTTFDIISMVSKGEKLEVISVENGWYQVNVGDNIGYVQESLVHPSRSLGKETLSSGIKDKKIVLDPGHGGRDVGAVGASGSYEKLYTTQTAAKLKEYLEILGAEVILTRKNDAYVSLSGRASLSNAENADAFVSIHYNSTPEYPTASGLNSYYYSERDQELASFIQESLQKETGMRNRGTLFASYQVLRENHRPSVLLELGFLSNVSEENKIQTAAFQEELAIGIIKGLYQYFSTR